MATDLDVETRLLIDGRWEHGSSADPIATYDPSTEEHITDVEAADESDVRRAVESSRDAFDAWRQVDPDERGRILQRFADAIRASADELAEIEAVDGGKPLSHAKEVDVLGGARYFEYYAGMTDKIQGDSIPLPRDYVDFTVREPYGVIGVVLPWNYPTHLFSRSVAPILAAGNTAVVKPAKLTPLSALTLGQLGLDAGLPPGVLNVVNGSGRTAGTALVQDPRVDKISFTGSASTGKTVGKLAMESVTPVHLELGGKNPVVIFADADIDRAIENTYISLFASHAGQVCSAGSRLLVQEGVHEEVVESLVGYAERMVVGNAIDDPDIGPLISDAQLESIAEYIDAGRREVGDPVTGGGRPDRPGYFVEPTIFDDVPHESRIVQEEIFGPVLPVTTFKDEAEAIELANDVEYGLVSGVFTASMGTAHRFARDIQAGQVYINEWYIDRAETPFGGYKSSGIGREKGFEGMREYTQVKNIAANIAT